MQYQSAGRLQQWRSRGRLLCSYVLLFPGYVFLRADHQGLVRALETNLVARVLQEVALA